ncbi:MAG: ChaN family lipoprotein [Cyanobacteria bacterium J06623_7]
MYFPLPTSIRITSILLAGLCLILPLNVSVARAEIIAATSTPEIVSEIAGDDVIYLGENHDSAKIHQQQLEIITQLQEAPKQQPEIIIAWEMFQRPFQPMLNRYLAGEITEVQLREKTEFDRRWGFDWEFYVPILRYARDKQISLVALNTPEEITQKVARSGIDSLEGSDYRYIPPLQDIDLSNAEYRQRLQDIYQQHVEAGQGNSSDADNFFAAQVLWDETMAEAIARSHQQNPESQIVVLVGKTHVMYDYAIPERVARRIDNPDLTQSTILLSAE